MSPISSKDVVVLRQKTGLGMMDCKKALEASDGDFERAVEFLRKKGVAKAEARLSRSTGEGMVDSYVHPGSRIGVLIEVGSETDFVARSDDFKELVHNLAMQVAAAVPIYVKREDIPENVIAKEMEIYREQMHEEKKPPDIIERIAKGKLEKFFKDSCLLEQPYIKKPDITVRNLILDISSKFKENIQIRRFTRYNLGE